MLSFDDFKALSIEDAYLAYVDKYHSVEIFSSRFADLNKQYDSLWDDYRMLYLSNSK